MGGDLKLCELWKIYKAEYALFLASDWLKTKGSGQITWTNIVQLFYTTYISENLAHHKLFCARDGKGGIRISITWLFYFYTSQSIKIPYPTYLTQSIFIQNI